MSHSQEMFHLLKEGGKSVELVELEHARHSIPKPQVVTSIEAFLDKHLGGGPAPR